MNKTAYDIVEDSFEKIAASFDARRKKQYWQMLKKMYGGSDDAVNAIRKTGDKGIYHATTAGNATKIMNSGVRASEIGYGGKGAYFGPMDKAMRYAQDTKKRNNAVRMKMPSEFSSSDSTLYPKGTKVMFASPKHMRKANLQTHKDIKKMNEIYPEFTNPNNPLLKRPSTPRNPRAKVNGDGYVASPSNLIKGVKADDSKDIFSLSQNEGMRNYVSDQLMIKGKGQVVDKNVLKGVRLTPEEYKSMYAR